jgi:drug/metabolite transporter (DMT)-like permease
MPPGTAAYNGCVSPVNAPVRSSWLAELGLFYCAAIWGSTFFVVKDALDGVDPVVLVGYRFILAALLLWPVIALRRENPWKGMYIGLGRVGPWPTRGESRNTVTRADHGRPLPEAADATSGVTAADSASVVATKTAAGHRRCSYSLQASPGVVLGLLLWVLYVAQTWGLGVTTASNSGFITGMFIIFIPLLSYLMHERRPTAGQLVAVAIAVAGLYLLTGGIRGLNSGDVLTLLAAVTYALHVMLTGRYSSRGLDPYVLCFQQMLITGGLSLLLAGILRLPFGISTSYALGAIIFLAIFPSLSAFLIQLLAQRSVPELRVSLIFTLEPVFGALFAWTLGGEQPILLRALGGVLIVAAMLVSELGVKRGSGPGPRDTGTV